jgi:hypothetical protein
MVNAPGRVASKIRRRSTGEMNALKGDSLRNDIRHLRCLGHDAHDLDQGALQKLLPAIVVTPAVRVEPP